MDARRARGAPCRDCADRLGGDPESDDSFLISLERGIDQYHGFGISMRLRFSAEGCELGNMFRRHA